jgi:C4-dicarboxylate-specific signal transduction histidine kinase
MKYTRNLSVYLLYTLLSVGFVLVAALIQIHFIYGTYEARMLVVPVSVGILFGLLIAKIRLLQKQQKQTLTILREKDQEIRELNQGLEKKVEAKTHELSEQRLYTESILNAQNSIVIITDGYTLVKANKAFFRYIDDFVSVDDFKSKYNCICDLFVDKPGYLQPDINDSRWTTYILNNQDRPHKAFITYNGHDYIFSVHAKKFIYGDTQKIIATFEDITQLMNYDEQLETKISEEIEANRKKEAIIFQQSRFAAIGEAMQSVSHHWRQPLSALSLMIQDIDEAKDFGELDQEYLRVFTSHSLELIKDMSDTLDSFKFVFANKKHETGEFKLEETVEKALAITRSTLKAEGIELSLNVKHPEVIVQGSPKEYLHVIVSILSNAVEALENTEEPKKISLTVDRDETGKSLLTIHNNGPKIPEEDLDKIFDPYFSSKFDKNGTGLGLFTSRTVIEHQMHGQVRVQNAPDGVRFTIRV